MSTIYWRGVNETSDEQVTEQHPLPVQVPSDYPVTTGGRLVTVGPITVPGTSTSAYAANDQVGTIIRFPVPVYGEIRALIFYDVSDQAGTYELWLFRGNPTLAADNAAFSLADATGLLLVEGVVSIGTFYDAVNGQVAREDALAIDYHAPEGILYGALKCLATPTITAGQEPLIALRIEPAKGI